MLIRTVVRLPFRILGDYAILIGLAAISGSRRTKQKDVAGLLTAGLDLDLLLRLLGLWFLGKG
jgi:hypothetical protein